MRKFNKLSTVEIVATVKYCRNFFSKVKLYLSISITFYLKLLLKNNLDLLFFKAINNFLRYVKKQTKFMICHITKTYTL